MSSFENQIFALCSCWEHAIKFLNSRIQREAENMQDVISQHFMLLRMDFCKTHEQHCTASSMAISYQHLWQQKSSHDRPNHEYPLVPDLKNTIFCKVMKNGKEHIILTKLQTVMVYFIGVFHVHNLSQLWVITWP